MSQVNSRPTVAEIDMICLSSTVNAGWSAGMAISQGCEVAQQAASSVTITNGAKPKLRSAAHVMEVLASVRMEMSNAPSIEKTRERFGRALERSGAMATNEASIEMVASRLHQAATIPELNAAMELVEQEVVRQHGQLMVEHFAVHVQEASREAGFGEIHIKREGCRLLVQALAPNGAGLPSTIHLDPRTGNVELTTETIGLPDGQCDGVMSVFNEALLKRGVKSPVHVKRSGRACGPVRTANGNSKKSILNKLKA